MKRPAWFPGRWLYPAFPNFTCRTQSQRRYNLSSPCTSEHIKEPLIELCCVFSVSRRQGKCLSSFNRRFCILNKMFDSSLNIQVILLPHKNVWVCADASLTLKSRLYASTSPLLHLKETLVRCSLTWERMQRYVLAPSGESALYSARLWPIKLQTICLKCFFFLLPCFGSCSETIICYRWMQGEMESSCWHVDNGCPWASVLM